MKTTEEWLKDYDELHGTGWSDSTKDIIKMMDEFATDTLTWYKMKNFRNVGHKPF